ncbi:MAG: LysR family transcriptional regulator [Verrucomicrobiales bacterium]|nr:LysR family transcriptional regulator [Verrucomicrobiales bacterium]
MTSVIPVEGSAQYFVVRSVMPVRHAAAVELRHLRYFVCVAETLHFTQAAAQLHVAQPALSRQIRQLEEELGVALLERNRRRVELTPAGRTFLLEARNVLAQSAQAVRAAQTAAHPHRGTLRVGYVWGLFHTTLPRWVHAFRSGAPEVSVHLFDLSATEQLIELKQGRIDLAFLGFEEGTSADDFARQTLGSCAFVAAVPAGHRLARARRLKLSDLAREMFYSISEDTYPGAARRVREAFDAAGFAPRVVQSAARGHTLLALVAAQCGVALVPETLAALPHPGVVLKPIQPAPVGTLDVAWSSRRPHALRDAFVARLPHAR